MSTSTMKILCRYQYDPLDRLTGLKPAEHVDTLRFYQNDELVNEIEGEIERTILHYEAQPLAQRLHIANLTETTLLATDQQRSVLQTLAGTDTQHMAYTAYGHRPVESGLSSLLGFNGDRPDSITGHYLLGQGNRAFNPVLMRFNSPDELSPFGDGGINAYAYCGGDPVNRYDPSGNGAIALFKSMFKNQMKALAPQSVIISRSRPLPTQPTIPQKSYKPRTDWYQRHVESKPTSGTHTTSKLPPESSTRAIRSETIGELDYQKSQRIYEARLKGNSHWYDSVVDTENPIPADLKLQKRYDSLQAKLEKLQTNGASITEIEKTRKKIPYVRRRAKQSALIIAGVIRKR